MEQSDEITLYEVAALRGVQPATVKNAIKSGKLKVHREAVVGARRTLPMFLRSDVDRWQPRESGASVKKAAKLLGIDEDIASTLKSRYDATGQMNVIEIVEGN